MNIGSPESVENMSEALAKNNPFSNDVIFIDGLWGTGKSLLGPIVSGMERVEKIKIELIYEYIATLGYLKKIDPDAASWMLKTYADMSQYNNQIGREVNLRWSDDSGLANNPNSLRYIKRLFGSEGDGKVDEVNRKNLALNIMSHMLMHVSGPIFEAFGKRARIIEIVRHPLYMVKHWYAYLERYESPREFTMSFDIGGVKVPWFALGWEDEYVESNLMDRVLRSIILLYNWLENSIREETDKGNQVLTLSFESLVMTPDEPLKKLESFLGRKHYPGLDSLLRKQKIPRKTISQGKGHAQYGWEKGAADSEEQAYLQHLGFVHSEGSSENIENFMKLISEYNERYPSLLNKYQ